MYRITRALAVAGLFAALTVAPAAAADEANVRVLHASPDAPAVDVHLDGAIVDALTNVPFGTISEYLPVPAGEHQVTVYATGTTESPVIDATVTVEANASYTIAATNALASIEAQVIADDAAPTADEAQVRVVHLSADAPAVDVAPDGADPADALAKGLEYPDATDYLSVPPDSYDLEVRLAGTTTVALQLDPIDVEAGTAYSVFAIGSAAETPVGDNALQIVAAVDATAADPAESAAPGGSEAPSITAPATSTVDSTDDQPTSSFLLPAALVIAIAFGAAFGAIRFATAATRR